MLRRIEKGGVFMKKKTISLILALILLLSCSATAQATSVQAATPSASITINGTTATCRVSIAKPGKTIHATLQLWQGRTMIDSWSGNGTSYLLITGSHEVTKGKTYNCTVSGGTRVNYVTCHNGNKYSIHSFINEDGYRWATLSFSCPNLFGETMSGEWSPDSANSYKDATP